MAELSSLDDFFDYAFPDESRRTVRYGLFAPGSYEYLVRPTARSLRWLANRLDGDAYRRRAAAHGFEALAAVAPRLLPALPGVSRVDLSVPVGVDVDVAIFGMRLKLLDFENGRAYTLPLDAPSLAEKRTIASEAAVRQRLPQEVRAPPIREFDDDYPYIAEALVPGDSPSDVVDDWPAIRDGLRQLRSLYRATTVGFVDADSVVDDAFDAFDAAGLGDDPVVERARQFLAAHALPDELRRCRVHGDYQTGNLLVSGGETYLLDWEFSRVDLCFLDCFSAFKRHAIESEGGGPLSALVERRGPYAAITDDIAETVGPLAYGDDSYYEALPVIYLLHQFAGLPDDVASREHVTYTLLRDVLDDVDA